MMERKAFAGSLSPVAMADASQVGVSVEELVECYDHIATSTADHSWIDASTGKNEQHMFEKRQREYSFLDKPVEWLLEPLAAKQPRAHAAFFASGRPRLLIAERTSDDVIYGRRSSWVMLLEVNERVVQPEIGFVEEGYCERMQFDEWLSLPAQIARSWLWRATGWKLPREVPCPPMVNRQMVRTTTEGIDRLLESFNIAAKEQKRLLQEYLSRFPDIAPSRRGGRLEMRCFLDTRPMGVSGPVGDQFFTRSKMRDGTVYHIRNGDVENLRTLHNPAEAIDCYHEHLLLKKPGEFDFSPWSRPL